jgi:uncharacterized protein YozE (UPF0346 family)
LNATDKQLAEAVVSGLTGDVSFYKWLRMHKKSDTAIGDLARDAGKDRHFPRTNKLNLLVRHLETLSACDNAIRTLYRAHAEWSGK